VVPVQWYQFIRKRKFVGLFNRGRDLVGYGTDRPCIAWPGAASLALNGVVNYKEGSEHSLAAGDEAGDLQQGTRGR
jgi:hypothetical protein